jgi:hypothetical protein
MVGRATRSEPVKSDGGKRAFQPFILRAKSSVAARPGVQLVPYAIGGRWDGEGGMSKLGKVQNHNRDREERRKTELTLMGKDESNLEDVVGEVPP